MRSRLAVAGLSVALTAGLVVAGAPAAEAQQVGHDRVVNANPVNFTPHALDGRVRAITQVGNQVVVGGTFTQIRASNNNTPINRPYLFSFNATTGAINNNFQPNLNDDVFSLAASEDGQSVYVGGDFTTVNGQNRRKVARLNLSNGAQTAGFTPPAFNGIVKDLKLANGRLYAGGSFTTVGTTNRTLLTALHPGTGALNNSVNLPFAGPLRGGNLQIIKMDITPNGNRLVAAGNFSTVAGERRHQIVMLDLSGPNATVANWYTPRFEPDCSLSFDTYMRDLDFSPDGSYFAVVTTGAYRANLLCDTASRWETNQTGTNLQPTWTNYSGGDTFWGVGVTGSAVYAGGHQRWMNNPFAADRAGQGAVPRDGIAALDPRNGIPFSWNPGRTRGVGVFDLTSTAAGLWMGSDTDRTGNFEFHGRLAMFPLAGAQPVPPAFPGELPGQVFGLGNQAGTGSNDVVYRTFDGNDPGATTNPGPLGGTWNTTRGAFMLSGTVYYGNSDGTFRKRSFNGTSFGAATTINLNGLTNFAGELPNVTGMAYDDELGRLYYTLAGQNNLYYRGFTAESDIVGADRFTAATNPAGLNLANNNGMFLAGNRLYTASNTGELTRTDYANGTVVPGTSTVVSGPAADGTNWRARGLFVYAGPNFTPNQAPNAAFTEGCAGLTCAFNGTGSNDPDGTIAGYAWSFGDGTNGTGASPSRTYTSPGTYNVELTVTDNDGATDTTSHQVEVTNETDEVTFRAQARAQTNATTHSIDVPNAVQDDDGMLLFTTANSTTTQSAPAGWALLGQRTVNSMVTRVYQKQAEPADPGSSVTVTTGATVKVDMQLLAYDGGTNPPVATFASAGETATTTNHTAPAINVPAPGGTVVNYWADKTSATTDWTPPAGLTQRGESIGAGGGRITSLATDIGAPAGNRPAATATASSASRNATMWTLVLRAG